MKSILFTLLMSCEACMAVAPAPAQPETVGQLSASYNSIAVAPVAPATDLSPGFQAVGTDADDDAAVVAGEGAAAAPDVVAKGGGLVAGAVR